jgi:lipopolysaccharide export system permease protein
VRTLDRYLTGLFLKNLLLAWGGLAAFYLFQATLSDLSNAEYQASQVLFYQFIQLPQILVQMAPPSVMMATVMTLSSLNRSNELTACFSIGVGLPRVVSLMIAVVILLSSLLLVSQDRILPPLYRMKTSYYWREMKKRTDFFLDVKQDKIWYRSKNIIYNLRTFDPNSRTIFGMAVYTFDDGFNLVQLIDAEKAEFSPNGWKLLNGSVSVFLKDDPFPLTKAFAQKELNILETPKDFQEIEREVDGLRLKELWRYIERTHQAGVNTKAYEVKFHARISLSFIPLVMCLIGVPFSTRNRREGGVATDIGLCVATTFFYWLFYSVGLSLGTNGALPPLVAAWLPTLMFMSLAGIWYWRSSKA